MTTGRIIFHGSPWPEGHELENLVLTVRGGEEGDLRLHLHAESVPYAESGNPTPTGPSAGPWNRIEDWLSWESAIISSTKWGNQGLPIPQSPDKFQEIDLDAQRLLADPVDKITLDEPAESLAFGCFVLGQNVCGDHELRLTRTGAHLFDLQWTGKIAATFVGETDFSAGHTFELTATGVRLT